MKQIDHAIAFHISVVRRGMEDANDDDWAMAPAPCLYQDDTKNRGVGIQRNVWQRYAKPNLYQERELQVPSLHQDVSIDSVRSLAEAKCKDWLEKYHVT